MIGPCIAAGEDEAGPLVALAADAECCAFSSVILSTTLDSGGHAHLVWWAQRLDMKILSCLRSKLSSFKFFKHLF